MVHLTKIYLTKQDKEFVLSEEMRIYLINKYRRVPIKQADVFALFVVDYQELLKKKK